MNCQSCLGDPSALIVIDASVVINLNASGLFSEILTALPNRVVVVEEVKCELENGRRNGHRDADALSQMVANGRIEIIALGEAGQSHFLDMVSGSAAETLDDGEAATIASALEQSALPILDERKANKLCERRYPTLSKGCTTDLFFQETALATLGEDQIANAVFNALFHGRMRVLDHHLNSVINLIGPDRATQCISLPKTARSR